MSMPDPESIREIEDAMEGMALQDDLTQFYSMEALHELAHLLGMLYHDQCMEVLERLDMIHPNFDEDPPPEVREVVGEFLAVQRQRYESWLHAAGLPYIEWYCPHISGAVIKWRIMAASPSPSSGDLGRL